MLTGLFQLHETNVFHSRFIFLSRKLIVVLLSVLKFWIQSGRWDSQLVPWYEWYFAEGFSSHPYLDTQHPWSSG